MRNFQRKKPCGFRRARSALHRHRRPKPVPARSVRRSVDQDSKQRDLRTIHPNREKLRDLRRIARSGSYNPSIFELFHKYHPEIKELEKHQADGIWHWNTSEWNIIHDMKYDWVTKIAGHWNAIGGSDSYFRHGRRAREVQAFRRAVRDDAWDDFFIPRERREWD